MFKSNSVCSTLNLLTVGWDVGVEGMREGGKRILTIPANMAYGHRGAAPDIPPNARLTFTIELRGVKK